MKMSDRTFFTIFAWLLGFVAIFVLLWILLGVVIAVLSFITWSLPLASPFTWTVFRIIFIVSLFLTTINMTTNDGAKEWIDDRVADAKKARGERQ
jgi:cell division protein FtsW (lipid II flippase)